MEDKQQTPENTNRFQSSRKDSSSPTRCAPRMPHSGLFPLHGAAHKNAVCQATLAGGISMPGGHPLYRLSTIHFKNSFLQILTYPVLSLLPAAPDSLILSRCLLLRYISSLEFPFQIPSSLMS